MSVEKICKGCEFSTHNCVFCCVDDKVESIENIIVPPANCPYTLELIISLEED